jgi:hypothetical protein
MGSYTVTANQLGNKIVVRKELQLTCMTLTVTGWFEMIAEVPTYDLE